MYKLCILAAGKGTRNRYALNSNKALLPLGKETALSYIIHKFPPNIDIVIAAGYNSKKIEDYLVFFGSYLLGDIKRLTLVYVSYEGVNRGPGYSLLQCAPYLQCPFIYMCCDTIVTDKIPQPTQNWIGLSGVTEKLPYLTLSTKGKLVKSIYDKGDKQATHLASIGLVGVKNYKEFWKGLANPTIVQGEYQDTSGIKALIPYNLYTKQFHWRDIGTTEGYEKTKQLFLYSTDRSVV